jgi:hypothetical protein
MMLMSVRGDWCESLGGSRREDSSVGREVERFKAKLKVEGKREEGWKRERERERESISPVPITNNEEGGLHLGIFIKS